MRTRISSGYRRRRAAPAILLLAAAVAVLALAASGSASGQSGDATSRFQATELTPDSTFTGAKSATGQIARTDPSLLGRSDSTRLNVFLKYDFDSTASYMGGVSGLKATSPSVTGKSLAARSAAVRAYDRYTAALSRDITAAAKSAAPGLDVRATFRTVYGGVAASVPANQINALLKVDGVVAVQKDSLQQPQTDATPKFIGATDVWPSLGGSVKAGKGVTVGVLDTGIWPEHPSFRDTGLPPSATAHQCQFGDGTDVAHLGPTFACNNKLVGAYAFTNTYLSVFAPLAGEYCNATTHICSARDADGHGTHTSSTAAGDPVSSAKIFGIERGPISGIAPGAHVIMYRVCLEQGCFQSDSVAAVQQAVLDRVNVINFSISGGAQPYSDSVELAFLDAFNAGISVNASAGNSGPGPATADHGGPWVTTVGASSSNRAHQATLKLTASNGDKLDLVGSTITPGIGPTPVVLATSIGVDALCVNPIPAGAAAGKIVACQRGPNRVLKSFNVMNGGGAGMILYNAGREFVMTDNHWVPSIHLQGPTDIVAFISGHTGVMGSWPTGAKTKIRGDEMTFFSSRGPLGDFVKPDVTAPGIQILAGMTPTPVAPVLGPPGQLFQAIGGTSMSSPHSAGASALVKAAHPNWTPAQIKSALMTSSEQDVVKEDGVTPFDPFDAGAGSIRVNRAVDPTLVFDETFANFVASAGDPLHRIDLNLASVDAPTMSGKIKTWRTALNVSGREQELDVQTEAPDGASITVGRHNHNIHVKKNQTVTFSITIRAPGLPNGQYFGRITLDPKKKGENEVTIPVAFFKRQGAVSLSHTCDTNTFLKRTGHATCTATMTNNSPVAANTELKVRNVGHDRDLEFSNPTPPATVHHHDSGIDWSGTLTPTIPPQVTAITPTTGPDGGYLALSLLGVGPIAGVGDDTISNFTVPTFYYGGEPYTRIGVVSNGYLVIGGGTSADIVFTPQHFPNSAQPNNTLAPLWTDLNPAAAGAIRIAVLTGGGQSWLTIDWAGVKNFGNATTHSFEVWIRIPTAAVPGPGSEQITFSYGPNLTFPGDGPGLGNAGLGDPDSGVNWGAENRNGTSGQNFAAAPANGSEWAIILTGPVAGGSASVSWDVSADHSGTFSSMASMTSNVTAGSTQVLQTFTVTRP